MTPQGRPRDTSVDTRVIAAVLDMLAEGGLAGVSIDGVAARAAVSKASIYRRWATKDELVIEAVATLADMTAVLENGDVRSYLIGFLGDLERYFSDSRAGRAFPWLAGEIAEGTALGLRYIETVILPKRSMVMGVLADAVERGDLRDDIDVDTVVDMLVGSVVLRRFTGRAAVPSEGSAAEIVDAILDGLRS